MTQARSNYSSHTQHLGRTRQLRRFLLSMLLTSRFHLSTRPISDANEQFFRRLAGSCDAILAALREAGWEELDEVSERGLAGLRDSSSWVPGKAGQGEMSREFKRTYRQFFRGLNVPWSHLAPDPRLDLRAWDSPSVVYMAFGPNIGIGDELIFFEAVKRLRETFEKARIVLSSFNATLWETCDCIDELRPAGRDQLLPFVLASDLVADLGDRALVIFVEFASTPMYRHLESLPNLPRFVYLDTGSRCARIVDQAQARIAEHVVEPSGGIYRVLDKLLDRVGLPAVEPASSASGAVHASGAGTPVRIFVNPFSSKDFEELAPCWWAECLDVGCSGKDVRIEIFAGINDKCRAYARAVVDGLHLERAETEMFGADEIPSIADTMREAIRSNVVFGLDTFTAHVGVLHPTPCLTLYFGSEWDHWRVSNNHALVAYVQNRAETVGRLLARLIETPDARAVELAGRLVEATRAFVESGHDEVTAALALLGEAESVVRRWAEFDAQLADTFVDLPLSFARALSASLHSARNGAPYVREACHKMINEALDAWQQSNIYRYAELLVAQ